jgi:hypothetical protein
MLYHESTLCFSCPVLVASQLNMWNLLRDKVHSPVKCQFLVYTLNWTGIVKRHHLTVGHLTSLKMDMLYCTGRKCP